MRLLIDSEGKVIDPTWDEPGTVDLGVPFDTKWSINLLRKRSHAEGLSRKARRLSGSV